MDSFRREKIVELTKNWFYVIEPPCDKFNLNGVNLW